MHFCLLEALIHLRGTHLEKHLFHLSKAVNLFEIWIRYCSLNSTSLNFLRLSLHIKMLCYLLIYRETVRKFWNHQYQSQLPSKIVHRGGCTRMPSPIYHYVTDLIVSLPIRKCPGAFWMFRCGTWQTTWSDNKVREVYCHPRMLGSNSWTNFHPIFPHQKLMSDDTEWQLILATPHLWKVPHFSVGFVIRNKWSTACKWPTEASRMLWRR